MSDLSLENTGSNVTINKGSVKGATDKSNQSLTASNLRISEKKRGKFGKVNNCFFSLTRFLIYTFVFPPEFKC